MRRLRGSGDVHTLQLQPGIGTPVEVPQPRTVSFIMVKAHGPRVTTRLSLARLGKSRNAWFQRAANVVQGGFEFS